jgi:hypothetical protein
MFLFGSAVQQTLSVLCTVLYTVLFTVRLTEAGLGCWQGFGCSWWAVEQVWLLHHVMPKNPTAGMAGALGGGCSQCDVGVVKFPELCCAVSRIHVMMEWCTKSVRQLEACPSQGDWGTVKEQLPIYNAELLHMALCFFLSIVRPAAC